MGDPFQSEFHDAVADSAVIHESCVVESPCQIGARTRVDAFSHVMNHVLLGSDCHLSHQVVVHPGVIIGNQVRILNGCHLPPGVIIENGVYIGAHTVFTHPKRLSPKQRAVSQISPTVLREGCSIGPHSVIGFGAVIGAHAHLGAHSMINDSVPSFAVMSGSPLSLQGWRCRCGHPLTFSQAKVSGSTYTECDSCGQAYELHEDDTLQIITEATA